jgi:hypothetical protein
MISNERLLLIKIFVMCSVLLIELYLAKIKYGYCYNIILFLIQILTYF